MYVLPALVVVIAGLSTTAAQLWVFPSEVDQEEWREPAAYVKKHLGPDDLVRVHPEWTEDPLPHLESVGDQISPQERPVAGDFQDVRRVWIVSETERVDGAVDLLPFEPSRPEYERFGDVTVVETRVPSSLQSSYELLDHLDEAVVERLKNGKVKQTCDNWNPRERRWDCGSKDPWLYVGEKRMMVGGDPHKCFWAHPLPKGKVLRITFPKVPLQKTLRVRAGLSFTASRKGHGDPVRMRVEIDDETRVDHVYPAHDSVWRASDIDTAALSGQRRDVVLKVTAPEIRDRGFCVNGWAN